MEHLAERRVIEPRDVLIHGVDEVAFDGGGGERTGTHVGSAGNVVALGVVTIEQRHVVLRLNRLGHYITARPSRQAEPEH